MATFVMLSSVASKSGNEFHPNPYQFFFINVLLGDSPGCKCDGYSQDFNKALWYAFTEILEGDYSLIRKVDLNPESWYSPESVINLEADVFVDSYLKDQEPEWFARMIEVRGEPRKYGSDYIFSYPENDAEEVESDRCDYEISQAIINKLEEETKQVMFEHLHKEVVSVSNLEQDEYGEYYGRTNEKLTQLYFKSDDECEYELAGKFKPTDAFVDGDRLYVEI
jgi:hypothetical protein